ncbi:MAG: hypothetical protein A2Z25_21995 [Planctomycetes bacterium RBG_16_55_9]|nr:MAG: hypothetical protein A2Z25_21995 [Planctomycetes bacterium RBG_16_55_9]
MNIYESLSSPSFTMNEQIARQVFDTVPEGGPLVLIMDRHGNRWPSNSDQFARLNISESLLEELCAKIDDGDEPIITQVHEYSIVAAGLATEQRDCGCILIAVPQSSPESTFSNVDLIEMLLGQFNVIARLIEKNNLLYEAQLRHYRVGAQSAIASN